MKLAPILREMCEGDEEQGVDINACDDQTEMCTSSGRPI